MVGIVDNTGIARAEKSDQPRRDTKLQVTINWLLVAILVLVVAIVVLSVSLSSMAEKASRNLEIAYVKLYPNGNREISYFKRQPYQEYLPATVDALLKEFIRVRFGVFPPTITRDYGQVGMFVSGALYQRFVDEEKSGGFDAVKKAAAIAAKEATEDRISIADIWIDHYDTVPAVFSNKSAEVVRTNIYYTKVSTSPQGFEKSRSAKIARLQWRLLDKKELEDLASKNTKILDVNPIGLEIVDYEEIDDPAGIKAKRSEVQPQ
ncbi:hypothetical protein OFL22_33020 [Pseudomonas aeruginosa]|uniref:hypothetical protein n=1 Tax=Pseudomonas aeruginosa TaxID=287 RepID=UPI00053DA204|nr:hypothetical protein [Pseudomonas aeruginosa]MCV6118738.1 hypothetical protein [Pseudomonas aeruginosa]MCV6125631.1 hypothetical protein [Pseudomonas aeruginosa]MCV6428485.1 hypothetical protein [Pseudomonas aeruginosa]ORL55891.1 hypothetical protein B7H20_23990 [Pseudomonas aeruginosa]UGW98198.1 hypothetical protein LSG40_33875 [Pseudomonas aeruginosa]